MGAGTEDELQSGEAVDIGEDDTLEADIMPPMPACDPSVKTPISRDPRQRPHGEDDTCGSDESGASSGVKQNLQWERRRG